MQSCMLTKLKYYVKIVVWQLHGHAVAGLFLADDHVRRLVLMVVVAVRVVVRRQVHGLGRFRLRVVLLLLLRLLHLLNLDDLGVAELLAEAADEAHRVDAVANHLQLVPGVAGYHHGRHPGCSGSQRQCFGASFVARHAQLDDNLLLHCLLLGC
ncbi:hypothetical protein D1007_08882 [Hordeum vulgare]|nr:hypothetical protein D1007_08882 [Hordeum vulgare]